MISLNCNQHLSNITISNKDTGSSGLRLMLVAQHLSVGSAAHQGYNIPKSGFSFLSCPLLMVLNQDICFLRLFLCCKGSFFLKTVEIQATEQHLFYIFVRRHVLCALCISNASDRLLFYVFNHVCGRQRTHSPIQMVGACDFGERLRRPTPETKAFGSHSLNKNCAASQPPGGLPWGAEFQAF